MDNQTYEYLQDWVNLINQQEKNKEDIWSEIPQLPNYKFLNLRIKPNKIDEENNEISINLVYDKVEKL